MLRAALPPSFHRPLLALAGLLSLTIALPAQETGKRVALIIGNDSYSQSPLKNAVNDARAMDTALRAANFRTVLVENAKGADMQTKLGEFLDMLGPDDTALFFYAGHGVQIANENFLVPVDFVAGSSLAGAKLSTVSVALIFEELKAKRAKKNIVILDACRSNPVAEKYSLEAGLAQPQNAGKETFVAFSTSIGQVAADNPDGRNSWFTEALSDYIGQANLTVGIDEIFNKVKKRVSDATEGKQTPWVTSSMSGAFYFHPPVNLDTENDPTLAEKWFDDARRREQRENWAEAIDLISQLLKKKPGGTLEAAARSKLQYLTVRKDAQDKFDAGDFAAAATAYEQAVKLDPFSIEAAFQGVNSYLLNDRISEAVALLKVIRIHGTSASTKKANALLQELSVVSKDAGTELQAGIPQPPPIEDIFSGMQFGVPDWDAGARRLQSSPVDLSKWTKDLTLAESAGVQVALAMVPAVVPAAVIPAEPATDAKALALSNAIFHVELVPTGEGRDLKIRRVENAAPQEFGTLEFKGTEGETPIVYDGKPVAHSVPAQVKVPVGKYEIRTVQDGKILTRQDVDVTPTSRSIVTVKK
ncbi:MAG: caspase family protein [Candidatus Solibacter sp.]